MQKINFSIIFFLIIIPASLISRSIHRPYDNQLPTITTSWLNDNKKYVLSDSHWELYPIFKLFDEHFFNNHLLPQDDIFFRNSTYEKIRPQLINHMIEELIEEIKQQKKQYTHFSVLQKKDFNRKRGCGLLILKCKQYPFVVKMFIETPKSFIDPWCKGREPVFFFYMGGGVNRHLTGLTRIKNLTMINEKIKNNSHWNTFISTPRKWYWLPKDPQWIAIHGKNIGPEKNIYTKIPGIYAIVADYIEKEKGFSLGNPHDRTVALSLCNGLDMLIDPHIQNFFIEKNSRKIVIVDTEHFPTVVGFKEKKAFHNYLSWYLSLAGKCAKDMFFRTKNERKDAQLSSSIYAFT